MMKGAQKQMIVVRTGDSRFYDEAYFVLRRNLPEQEKNCRKDLLDEANRILSQGENSDADRPSKKTWRYLLAFLGGVLAGGGLGMLFGWLFFL